MFVPNDDAKPFSIQVSRGVIRFFAGFVLLFMAATVFFLLTMGRIGVQLQLVQLLKHENENLKSENTRLSSALSRAERTEILGSYLRRLALLKAADSEAEQVREALIAIRDTPDISSNKKNENDSTPSPLAGESSDAKVALFASIPTISPVEGWITKEFESGAGRAGGAHTGIDFAAAGGTPIRATGPGVVIKANEHRFFGLQIVLDHGSGYTTRYGHCSQLLVKKGEAVERGQSIALVGNTGRSTAPHLHYEVMKDGVPVDPTGYIFTTTVE